MLKLLGAIVVMISCAGILQSWRASCALRIREMEQICAMYRCVRRRMQTEHSTMPLLLREWACSLSGGAADSVMASFLDMVADGLEAHQYPTGEQVWSMAVKQAGWHLRREETELLERSGSAFFGRDLEDNLQKMSGYEAQMEAYRRTAGQEFAEKNRLWTPVGMLMGVLLVIVFL